MAGDKDNGKQPDGGRSGGRRRPVEPRPIELEATEIREEKAESEAAQEAQAAAGREEPGTAAPEAEARTDDAAVESAGVGDAPAEPSAEDAVSAPADGSEPAAPDPEAQPPHEPVREPAPTRSRSGRGAAALIFAGLAGGAVALVVAAGLSFAGLWPRPGDGELRATLAEADARIATLEAAEPELPAIEPAAVEALADRLAALEARLDEAAPPDLGPIEERLAALEEAAPPDLGEIEQRLEALEAAPPAAALPEEAGEQLSAVEGDLQRLADQVSQLGESVSQIETAVAEERGAREALGERVDRLHDMIGEAEAAAGRELARAAAGSVALSSLSRAVEAGRPYAAELDAIRPLIPADAEIETLTAHAETGLPTSRALAERFAERSTAILAAGEEPAERTGVAGWVAEALGGLVRVRPAGPVEGDSRAAIVSRIEAALAEGDLASADSEWQALDPAAQEAAAQWGAALQARLAAERELTALTAATTAALSAPSGQPE